MLAAVGAAARAARQRLTCHPSHYVQLATPDAALRARSMRHLELNARVFDLMGYAPSHDNKINIHVGGHYGCKRAALHRFAAALDGLTHSCRARLTGGVGATSLGLLMRGGVGQAAAAPCLLQAGW